MFPLRHFTLVALAALAALALLVAPRATQAQRVLGIGDDASTLSAGVLRITAGALWDRANERYDADGKLRALGAASSTTSWNGRYDARLGAANPLVSTLSGLTGFDASLGALAMARRDATVDAPVELEFGATSRLTVGVRFRVASHAIEPAVTINPARIEGTMGFNPAWSNSAARDLDAQLLAQFDSATAQTARRIAQCPRISSPSGVPRFSSPASAPHRSLVAGAGAFAAALNQLYGGRAGASGLPFVPVSSSAAHQAIAQRVLGFRDQFAAFGNGAIGTQGSGRRCALLAHRHQPIAHRFAVRLPAAPAARGACVRSGRTGRAREAATVPDHRQ